jgi:hypothetical protein
VLHRNGLAIRFGIGTPGPANHPQTHRHW